MIKKKVCIIGMGPAGLMAGTVLLEQGFEVHFFDQKKTAGRKFLVAGDGGFNLTHSEDMEIFLKRYNHPFLQNAFLKFDNNAWRSFLEGIGIKTYIGSSGKIFPEKGIKPIEVLTKWLEQITSLGANVHHSHTLLNFDQKEALFTVGEKQVTHHFDFLILSMGGASWAKTGSTGNWIDILKSKGVDCIPFEASNAGFDIANWKQLESLEGQRIKNIEVKLGDTLRLGDLVITKTGLEGPPIYFVNKAHRANRSTPLILDLKPGKTEKELHEVLSCAKNVTEGLKKLNFSKTVIQLIKIRTTKEAFLSVEKLAFSVKNMPFKIQSTRPIDEAISTVGGISMEAVTDQFQLKKWPNIFACGEMLDWDAPTGGYLIQGCVSTGRIVGEAICLIPLP